MWGSDVVLRDLFKFPMKWSVEVYQSLYLIQMACFSLGTCEACDGSLFLKTMKSDILSVLIG